MSVIPCSTLTPSDYARTQVVRASSYLRWVTMPGRARPNTTSRGYGGTHQKLRARWAPKVAASLVDCAKCGQRIQPGMAWDLGHNADRTAYTGPEHRHCNRSDGGRRGAQATNARQQSVVREW